jgi:alpha-glucosidase
MRNPILALLVTIASASAQTNVPLMLTSPNGQLAISFGKSGNQLTYAVIFRGASVLEPSELGLELQGQPPLGGNIHLVSTTTSTTDETYHLVTGKTSVARNHFNALRLELAENGEPNRQLIIEARVYDDAVCFRYVVPEQPNLHDFNLVREKTEFRLAKDATCYALELPNFRSMYEAEFIKLPASAFGNQGGVPSQILIGCPMLVDMPGVAWMAITEADLRDYSSMYLLNAGGGWIGHSFESVLAPQVENTNLCVTGTLPHHSAWRVLMIASDPGRFIESTVITSLNPPCAIADTSWIHAGKASWDWWSGSLGPDGKPAYTTDTMKYYVDFAAKSGFEYMLIDAGWYPKGNITKMNGRVDVPEVVRYAKTKNVKIWIWAAYTELNRQMDEAMALYEKWGVAGIKTDFVERDDQQGMEFYYRSAEKAAQHHLLMDYHGPTKPSGIERTWPNILGYEAVAGMEQSKAGARDNPDHHLTLPFTRMLAGPMDYTPGGFNNVTREEFESRPVHPMVMGTRAHHLAMYVVYQASSQMVSDWPRDYEGQPEFQFIKDVPATWDETRALNGVPAEYVTIARRSGNNWFLGTMCNWTPREIVVPLDFLGSGKYIAEIYADAPDAAQQPKHVTIQKKTVTHTGRLRLQLAPGGGCAVRFVPKA